MLFTESHVYVLRGVLKNIYIHSTWNSHCTATRPVSVGPKCEGHDVVGPYEQLSVAGVEGEVARGKRGRARSWRPVCDGTD